MSGQGESRARGSGVTGHKLGLDRVRAILCGAAAWQRVHRAPPAREELFRALTELEGVPVLAWYASQRVCWERGWLVVGTCELTAAGWAALAGAARGVAA